MTTRPYLRYPACLVWRRTAAVVQYSTRKYFASRFSTTIGGESEPLQGALKEPAKADFSDGYLVGPCPFVGPWLL